MNRTLKVFANTLRRIEDGGKRTRKERLRLRGLLRKWRANNNTSIQAFASRLGVTRGHVWDMEAGNKTITDEMAHRILKAMEKP